ncbi:PREDICTED: postacrosomal sheath WW domain-binding protein isoform X2 [Chinchilla lanigera]|uniref:postacrosomal sheath WW domain-binding protein isoform X2 n=1 Tax=Chinchilla lanigera TaxID=34839 RepID=UPI00038ECD46|nr:PREDICTED: postacrosomal sheath WW domain-binding protein isoform X2 [Chinchilla lanigera]XP_005379450.1 PREDICTED: postacrosomal sheath WW domain-binding protein isoform X2 [Chinchilla lanigera]XP_005379451.1 PREDICTED: postacrosomal sheath WW domain-binding protein isoform X2 [Chinchilla lanigera]
MAVNQSHTENRRGVAIPYGESVLNQYPDVELSFPRHPEGYNLFGGTKRGTLFLTSYRVIFVTARSVSDPMVSFTMPFDLMRNCTVEQPIFGANYITGTIQAAPDGGWEGEATFKLVFRKGGAIHFAQLMMEASSAAAQGAPLGTDYWFRPLRIYVVTGEAGVCPPEAPCQAVAYGVPPPGYGALPAGYGAPPAGYVASPAGYGAPPPGYGAPPPGYGAPPPGYGAPPPGYGAPPPGYGAPPPRYGAPPPGYGVPPGGYGAPPPRYETPPPRYGAQPGGSNSPPPRYETPPTGFRPEARPSGSRTQSEVRVINGP